jgi:hypothetical protein
MVYGTDAGIMALAYGGSKSSTPAIVTTANQTATSIVNAYLNLTKDLSSPPQIVIDATNLVAAEIVKNPRTELSALLEAASILLETIRGEITEQSVSRWANMRFV